MLPLSTHYAVMNGHDICVFKGSKSRCWAELKRRRSEGDTTAWLLDAPGLKVGGTCRYEAKLDSGEG